MPRGLGASLGLRVQGFGFSGFSCLVKGLVLPVQGFGVK